MNDVSSSLIDWYLLMLFSNVFCTLCIFCVMLLTSSFSCRFTFFMERTFLFWFFFSSALYLRYNMYASFLTLDLWADSQLNFLESWSRRLISSFLSSSVSIGGPEYLRSSSLLFFIFLFCLSLSTMINAFLFSSSWGNALRKATSAANRAWKVCELVYGLLMLFVISFVFFLTLLICLYHFVFIVVCRFAKDEVHMFYGVLYDSCQRTGFLQCLWVSCVLVLWLFWLSSRSLWWLDVNFHAELISFGKFLCEYLCLIANILACWFFYTQHLLALYLLT